MDLETLGRELADELRSVGFAEPEITIEPADEFERQASGKLRRFVPLA